jgi:hypothetical protein
VSSEDAGNGGEIRRGCGHGHAAKIAALAQLVEVK